MTAVDSITPGLFETPERLALAQTVQRFTTDRIVPHLREWEAAGELPRWLHEEVGELGLLGLSYDATLGGSDGDLIAVLVMTEAVLGAGGSGGLISALFTHGISIPHVVDAARRRLATGDAEGAQTLIETVVRPTLTDRAITALGVTEPDGGSDVGALRTTATALDANGIETDPDSATTWRINGAKAYITSGTRADFVVVAARAFGPGAAGIALYAVPTSTPGFGVVSRMSKMGWLCSDTAELAFTDMDVPAWTLLTPAPGTGFASLARHFAVERLTLAITAYATAQRCLDLTVAWTRNRETFGRLLVSRQVVRHDLVEMHRLVDVARTYTRDAVASVVEQVSLDDPESMTPSELLLKAALAKNTSVAACEEVVAKAVQLHGGYGFLRDAEVEMHYRDAKVLGIGGGATQVMTDLAA